MYRKYLFFISIILVFFSFDSFTLADEIAHEYKDFSEVDEKLLMLARNEKPDKALKILNNVRDKFPANEYQTINWLVYFNRITEKYDECLNLWEEGHRKGYFFGIIPSELRYQVFYDNLRFIKIAEKDAQLLETSLEKSKTIYEIRTPDNYTPDKKYPILFALHGGRENIWHAKTQWQSDKLFSNYIIVYMQSYLYDDYISYGWDVDDPRGRKYFQEIFTEVKEKYSIDSTGVIIAGLSAGGYIGCDITFNNIIPITGYIGVCTGLPENLNLDKIRAARDRGLKAFLIAGENDYMISHLIKLEKLFIEGDLQYQFHIIENLGHAYPPDLSDWIDKSLEFFQKK